MELATHKTVTAMKPKNIFSIFIIMMSICLFSCSKNDDGNGGGNGDGTEVKNGYTATADIKTVTLATQPNREDVNGENEIIIYEDYNNRYSYCLHTVRSVLDPSTGKTAISVTGTTTKERSQAFMIQAKSAACKTL